MADISQITLPSNDTYFFKDAVARREHNPTPLETKTYTDVIATANDNNGAGFFYMKVVPDSMTNMWHIKVHVKATVPASVNYQTYSTFDLWGMSNTYSSYESRNRIYSTSYRPIYYNSCFLTNSTGYANGCGHWIGFNLVNSMNPTNTSLKRTVIVDLLQYEGCTVEMQDSLITPTNIPNRAAHTNWYASGNTSYSNFDACNQGLKQTGDANTINITNLVLPYGNYTVDSVLYRYQLLFQMDDNVLTPLNNANNVTGATKTMLTDVEFNPFGHILYYNASSTISADASINPTYLSYQQQYLDIRYTFNVVNGDFTLHLPIYLKVTPTSRGKCKIASANPLTQTLPTTNDGYWYIFLGRVYSWYQIGFYKDHPVYMHDGTTLRRLDFPVYESKPASSNGTDVSLVTTGEKYTWSHKLDDNVGSVNEGKFLMVAADGDIEPSTGYESKAATSGGTDKSLVTTGEKYTWNNKLNTNLGSSNAGKRLTVSSNGDVEATADYDSKAASSGGTDKSLVTTGEKYSWNNKLNANLGSSNAGKLLAVATNGSVETVNDYESKTASSGGTAESLVTTGEKYIWNNKLNANLGSQYAGKVLGVSSTGEIYPASYALQVQDGVWADDGTGVILTESLDADTLMLNIIPGTTTTTTFDGNNNPLSIVYNANGVTVRTDTFVWGTDTVTETRTASGKYITIVTDLTTLTQMVSEIQEVQ